MTDELADVFGEDLAKNVEKKMAERREERNSISDEQMQKICSLAINEAKFEDGDPQFTYTTDSGITHNVLLMQVPDPNNGTVWEYLDEPWDGAASIPFDYLGMWMNVTFPDKNVLAEADMEAGDWYIIAGEINTYTAQDGSEKESVLARGMVHIRDAKGIASDELKKQGFDEEGPETEMPDERDVEEEAEEVTGSELEEGPANALAETGDDDDDEEEESSSGGLDGLLSGSGDDEEEEVEEEPSVDEEEIHKVVEVLAQKDEEVWEVDVHDDDDPRADKLTKIVMTQTDEEPESAVRDAIADRIEEESEDDEEEELEDDLF